jgi:hypothetical protein
MPALSPAPADDPRQLPLMLNTFTWLDPEETSTFARRHIIFLFAASCHRWQLGAGLTYLFLFLSLPSALATTGLIWRIIALGGSRLAGWAWVDWSNDYYIITSRRILYQERVVLLYDSRQESPMEAVQSTSTQHHPAGPHFGVWQCGHPHLHRHILFRRCISNPDQVMASCKSSRLALRRASGGPKQRLMENMIERRITYADPGAVQTAGRPAARQPDNARNFLSDLFHLRNEVGGTILYRTHWFILLQKVPAQPAADRPAGAVGAQLVERSPCFRWARPPAG